MHNEEHEIENHSEVAAVLRRIRQEYEAAERGLHGFSSGSSRHEVIAAKTHRHLSDLLGDEQKATQLLAETIWALSDGEIPPASAHETHADENVQG